MTDIKLIKVSTYAKWMGVSVQTVYLWIKQGIIESTEIDGVKFIKIIDTDKEKDK